MRSPISNQCQRQVQFGHRSCRSVQIGGGSFHRSASFGGFRSSFPLSASASLNHSPDISPISPLRSQPPPSPWLLVPVNTLDKKQYPYCFFSLADFKIFEPSQSRLPWDDEFVFPDDTVLIGSCSLGWVLIKHPQSQQMHLINPLFPSDSVAALPLIYPLEPDLVGGSVTKSTRWSSPRLSTEFAIAEEVYDYLPPESKKWEYDFYATDKIEFYPKFAMSSVPSDPTCTVMVQCFGILGFWKPGQVHWTPLYNTKYTTQSIVYSKIHQCFFVLDYRRNVDAWRWDSDSPQPRRTSSLEVPYPLPSPKGDIECERYAACCTSKELKFRANYLVESSSGDLLMVQMFSSKNEEEYEEDDDNEDDQEYYPPELQFFTYKLNFEERKWEHVKSLGDSSLFMGTHYALCAHVGDYPGIRPNCIYFTGDLTDDVQNCPRELFGEIQTIPLDTGVVFNMDDATIHPFTIPSDKRAGPSVWFLPNPNSV